MIVRRVALGVAMAVMAVATHARVQDWQSNVTLWTAEVAADPQSIRGHLNLGIALDTAGDLRGAGEEAMRSVQLSQDPRVNPWLRAFAWAAGLSNFAHAAIAAGDYAQAEQALRLVLSEHPEFRKAHYNAGVLAVIQRQCARANAEFQQAGVHPWPCDPVPPSMP